MKKLKSLNLFQKSILALLAAMALLFTGIYGVTTSRVGMLYQDAILVPETVGTDTVYTGEVYGEQAVFTVTADKAVTFAYGGQTYGPYTAQEDPTAIPEEHDLAKYMTGVEIRQGEEVFFRGGVFVAGAGDFDIMLFNEEGDWEGVSVQVPTSDGNARYALSAETILELMRGPELTHKGAWLAWFCGVLISAVAAASILFADELFRFQLSFQVRDPDRAEPSEWELMWRHISWVLFPIFAVSVYIMGLE